MKMIIILRTKYFYTESMRFGCAPHASVSLVHDHRTVFTALNLQLQRDGLLFINVVVLLQQTMSFDNI